MLNQKELLKMKKNETIRKRIETILTKKGYNAEESTIASEILTDCVETLFAKDVKDIDGFIQTTFDLVRESEKLDVEAYEQIKQDFVIRKPRQISQEVKDARFDKAYKKLLEKYGKVGE